MKQLNYSVWLHIAITVLVTSVVLISLIPVVAFANGNVGNVTVAGIGAVALLMCYIVGGLISHHFQISLRVLLAFVTMLGIALALLGNRLVDARRQGQAVATIIRVGGTVNYDYYTGFDGWFRANNGLMFPHWVLEVCGKDVFGRVSYVSLDARQIGDEALGEIDLHESPDVRIHGIRLSVSSHEMIGTLTQLRTLWLSYTGTTDRDLKRVITGLKNIEDVYLVGIPITDGGLEHLRNLPKLKYVFLKGTKTTPGGLATLQERLPGCRVVGWRPQKN